MPKMDKDRPMNKMKRSALHQKAKRDKAKTKLSTRLARKKAEAADPALKAERLAKNIPRTIENTRVFIGEETGDKRLLPVQFKDAESMELDMGGLEDLFGSKGDSESPQKILLTTSPKPDKRIHPFLQELKSLFGGDRHVDLRVRKNQRYELSKVCKWASKRNYKAIAVVGDVHNESTTLTLSRLPEGPTAHFRVTSITHIKDIWSHGAATDSAPELVLSNMSTPLGLSVGRLLQSLFPPQPEFIGRQVVAVHNMRDFIFFRRFRYQFALRETELAVERAKERGMDTLVRARMQELGPRLTLKLRWIKRGTLASGRRRANGTIVDLESGGGGEADEEEEVDPEAAAVIDEDAAQELQDQVPDLVQTELDLPQDDEAGEQPVASTSGPSSSLFDANTDADPAPATKPKSKKRKGDADGIKIPRPAVPAYDLDPSMQHRRKRPKPGASILDSINLQGGVREADKEWAWKAKMQVKKNRFVL